MKTQTLLLGAGSVPRQLGPAGPDFFLTTFKDRTQKAGEASKEEGGEEEDPQGDTGNRQLSNSMDLNEDFGNNLSCHMALLPPARGEKLQADSQRQNAAQCWV